MEIATTSEIFELDDPADVGVVRRRFAAMASVAGFDEARAGDAALIATELASNVIKHAKHGGVLIGSVVEGERTGVAIAAWDRGPGMNVDACLRDGMSTAGTRGAGLGAVQRIANRFDAYAQPGRGSVVTAALFAQRPAPARFAVGAACVPYPGELVSGDAWRAHVRGDRLTVLVVDGLGHGAGAAAAAAAVLAAFAVNPDDPLSLILERAHRAAHATRGAAATIARIDLAAREVLVAGVGNVAAWLVDSEAKQLVTQHGTLGQAVPTRVREERIALPPRGQLVLCSDGLKSRWSVADHPGLIASASATIAATLWRDLSRGRDDATVVVARPERAA